MPLDEREQRILEEIERQFYQDDPKLAETVANTTLQSLYRKWTRLAFVGFAIGLIVMLASFTRWTAVALVGFVVMVVSAGWIAMHLRRSRGDAGGSQPSKSWLEGVRQRWQRDR
ncbi:MAG: DUF3040 domain-containing protein [Actinomycetota bacterium]|nr:DUF3040 domain-containing protein [Actinomycetota bacterium]